MFKLLLSLLAAIMIAGPAADASPGNADGLSPGKSTPGIAYILNATAAKYLDGMFIKTNDVSPQPSDNNVINTQPSKDPGKAQQPSKSCIPVTPQPTKGSVTATPQPSKGIVTATPQPTKGSVTATPQPSPSAAPEPSGKADNLSYEKQVAVLVNKERAANGLAPLTLSAKISDVARLKSQDMHYKGYFSHTSPTYGSPFDMLKTFNISYRSAGENIAMGYMTPEAVVNAWMNSPGHRANILNASYTQIGVGYVADGHYWTQLFIG